MTNIKLRIGGKWVTIGGGELVSEANSYTDQQVQAVNSSIATLNKDLGNTNDYIDGSFRDGIITEVEAKKIQAYLNTLTTSKNDLDQRTSQILANTSLPKLRSDSLTAAKSNFDSKYNALITSINNAIVDGKATTAESADVDAKFSDFNAAVSLLTDQLEQAATSISLNQLDQAQQFSSSYTDAMKASLNIDVSTAQNDITSAKAYIDPVFQGGIIYDAQRTQINSWMTTLANDKTLMDNRYTSIDGNADLTDATSKSNLETSYSSYVSSYNAFVSFMNGVLAGSQVSTTQASDFDTKINDYSNSLSLLSASGEESIDSIATTKGNRANANAKIYSDAQKAISDPLEADLQQKTTDLKTTINNAFSDGMIIVNEQTAIQTGLTNLSTSKSNYDNNYNSIYNDPNIGQMSKNLIYGVKLTYDGFYQTLVTSINNAIADNMATGNETFVVDTNFTNFTQSVSDLKTQLDAAIDYIAQKKADAAEFAGYSYTDTKLIAVDGRITTVEQNIQTNSQNITDMQNNVVYKVDIISSNGLVFKNGNLNTILSAKVWYGQTDVTDTIDASKFTWTRFTGDSTSDSAWNSSKGVGSKTMIISSSDVGTRATFTCSIST